ncbi:MAG: hypothetical protein AB8B72_06030 [Crocinitomicaceae bacterium]
MKKHLLMASAILLSTIGFCQEKFYTNNFSKEVKELNTSMKTIGFTTVLPSNYTKYNDIVAVIDNKDEGLYDYYTLNFYYNLLPVKDVPSSAKMKYVIESGSNNRSDFTSLFRRDMDVDFKAFHSANYKARTYRYQTIVVKVMGRLKVGMHWVDDEYLPKWKYEELSYTEIKLDLGEPEPTFTTENGLFTYKKYNTGKALTRIYADEDSDDIKVIYAYGEDYENEIEFKIYEIEAGEVKQETFDMSGPSPTASKGASVDDMIKEIKLNLKKTLVKSSCYNEARSVKLQGQRIASSKITAGIYGPYMLDSGKKQSNAGSNALGSLKSIGGQFVKQKGGSDKYNKFINSPESNLNWTRSKLGNADFEFLELDLYNNKQYVSSSSNKSKKLKDGEEGKTQKVIIFLGKVDGKLYAGLFTKSETEEMNEDDIKFKDFILSTFKVNK